MGKLVFVDTIVEISIYLVSIDQTDPMFRGRVKEYNISVFLTSLMGLRSLPH